MRTPRAEECPDNVSDGAQCFVIQGAASLLSKDGDVSPPTQKKFIRAAEKAVADGDLSGTYGNINVVAVQKPQNPPQGSVASGVIASPSSPAPERDVKSSILISVMVACLLLIVLALFLAYRRRRGRELAKAGNKEAVASRPSGAHDESGTLDGSIVRSNSDGRLTVSLPQPQQQPQPPPPPPSLQQSYKVPRLQVGAVPRAHSEVNPTNGLILRQIQENAQERNGFEIEKAAEAGRKENKPKARRWVSTFASRYSATKSAQAHQTHPSAAFDTTQPLETHQEKRKLASTRRYDEDGFSSFVFEPGTGSKANDTVVM